MLKSQNIKLLDNKLVSVFHYLELSGSNSYLIGSANIRNILYSADYDLNENMNLLDTKSILQKLYREFLHIFNTAHSNKDYYIVDFKCGYDDTTKEAIRWSYVDIKKGYQRIKGKTYSFEYCLLQDGDDNIIKLDMVYILNNIFTDINILYNLHIVTNKKQLNGSKLLVHIHTHTNCSRC